MRGVRNLAIEPSLIDQLVAGRDARAVFERDGILDKLRLALSERFPHRQAPAPLEIDLGEVESDAAADIARVQLRFPDLGDRILALHAKGHTQADIQRRATMLIGQPLPSALVPALLEEMRREALDWKGRALEPGYPIVVFERMRVKWRDGVTVQSKQCYFALGFQSHGPKEVIGLWFDTGDERGFWLSVLEDLRARGVTDVLYFLAAGAPFNEARLRIFPAAAMIAHIGDFVRRSLDLATTKDRSAIAKALRAIHGARDESSAQVGLNRFVESALGQKYPAIWPIWRGHWHQFATYFDVPFEIRRVMASTYAADVLRRGYKRTLRGHGHMTSVDEAIALLYLAVRETLVKWKRPQREWHAAKTQLAVLFPERFVAL
jgi:putative transposase